MPIFSLNLSITEAINQSAETPILPTTETVELPIIPPVSSIGKSFVPTDDKTNESLLTETDRQTPEQLALFGGTLTTKKVAKPPQKSSNPIKTDEEFLNDLASWLM